jgi:hypothetical protein
MTEQEWKSLNVKLSQQADELLRQNLRRRGDLSRRFTEALQNTVWDSVDVISRRKTYQPFFETSIAVSMTLYQELKEYALKREIEISPLIDAIIISYYSR